MQLIPEGVPNGSYEPVVVTTGVRYAWRQEASPPLVQAAEGPGPGEGALVADHHEAVVNQGSK